jgi:group I intron endonuclease
MGIIYCLTSPSGKKYIGQTKRSFDKRLKEHSKCEGNCIILENAIKKYGIDSFDYEILIEINDTLLDEYETKFIDLLDTLEPNGYNVRSGGKIAAHSELSKERMRQSKLGEKNHNYGKPRSELAKQHISESKSGVNHHFYGKELSEIHKLALSKSFKKYDKDLPMYIAYLVERPDIYQSTGYVVKNHPHLKTKYFTSKKYTLEEKLIQAKEYLNSAMDAVQRLNGDGFILESIK